MQIIFLGGGNMAEAIFAKLNSLDLSLVVIQRNLDKLTQLKAKYPFIRFSPVLDFTPTVDDIIILAVKPQDAKAICLSLPKNNSTIASIMAGISTKTLTAWLNTSKLIRIMPNTPGFCGLAATGLYFNSDIPQLHQQTIKTIFTSIGKIYTFENEDFIDKMTAVAASSPAYIFYFIEAMIDTAIKQFNFSPTDARDITLQVVKGSLSLIENTPEMPISQLRSNVTSKKGTTEQAINVFDNANLKQIILEAEVACYNRAKELSNLMHKE